MHEENGGNVAGDLSLGAKFINPAEIIDMLEIKEGMEVGDFGCGTGYFSFPLAKKVGQNGRVYSLDILKEKLEAVESEAKVLGLSNIIVKRANLEMPSGSKMQDASLDWVCLVNMLFQNKNKKLVIEEAVRVLKKGGKILIIEWNNNETFGPGHDLRIAQDELSELALNCQLTISRKMEISNFHYGIILEK